MMMMMMMMKKYKKLKKQMDELLAQKEQALNKINNLKNNQQKQIDDLIDYSADVNYAKKKLFMEKEHEIERRRMFNANKKAYYLMQEDIKSGKMDKDKIVEPFREIYETLDYLNTKGVLHKVNNTIDDDVGEDYFVYSELIKGKPKETFYGHVPHNYHYLSEDEQKKFSDQVNKRDAVIKEFRNNKEYNFKSLDEYLDDAKDSDEDETENQTKDDESDNDIPDIKMDVNNNLTSNGLTITCNNDDNNMVDKIEDYDYNKVKDTVNRFKNMFT